MGMSNEVFALALLGGAALLAVWLDARGAVPAPDDLGRLVLHAVVALALLQLIPSGDYVRWFALVALFGAALPALVYASLVVLWTLKLVRGATRAFR
jgi:hypothetical protein